MGDTRSVPRPCSNNRSWCLDSELLQWRFDGKHVEQAMEIFESIYKLRSVHQERNEVLHCWWAYLVLYGGLYVSWSCSFNGGWTASSTPTCCQPSLLKDLVHLKGTDPDVSGHGGSIFCCLGWRSITKSIDLLSAAVYWTCWMFTNIKTQPPESTGIQADDDLFVALDDSIFSLHICHALQGCLVASVASVATAVVGR